MHLSELRFRLGTSDDAPQIAAVAADGWETYRSFAPPGWVPPPVALELKWVVATIAKPSAWLELAEEGPRLVGHAGFTSAREARIVDEDPRLAHLWQLMVRQERWGSGLAARLQADAFAAAAERGFERMRLYTPADHARARRFYEREGWTLARERFLDEGFGMDVVEYRRAL